MARDRFRITFLISSILFLFLTNLPYAEAQEKKESEVRDPKTAAMANLLLERELRGSYISKLGLDVSVDWQALDLSTCLDTTFDEIDKSGRRKSDEELLKNRFVYRLVLDALFEVHEAIEALVDEQTIRPEKSTASSSGHHYSKIPFNEFPLTQIKVTSCGIDLCGFDGDIEFDDKKGTLELQFMIAPGTGYPDSCDFSDINSDDIYNLLIEKIKKHS